MVIAYKTVFEAGPAVFTARAILGIDADDNYYSAARLAAADMGDEACIVTQTLGNWILFTTTCSTEPIELCVYDLQGKLIFRKQDSYLDKQELPGGIWFVCARSGNEFITMKFWND